MASAVGLEAEDYLWPLGTLRDTLLHPGASIPSPKLRLIFEYHVDRLRRPWRRAKDNSKDGPNPAYPPTVSPVPGVQVEVDEPTRNLARQLAEHAGIAATDACLIAKSYVLFVNNGLSEGVELEHLLKWYGEECLALAHIVLEILHLSQREEQDAWVQLAEGLRGEIVPDPTEYIQGLFTAWAELARRDLTPKQREEHGLFWASHQLRLQSAILDILFLVLYQTTDRPVRTAEGLIRGFIRSGFATLQVNRDIWESSNECLLLAARMRDLSLLIVLESFGLGGIVSVGDAEPKGLLSTSSDIITALHLFINEQTADLSPSQTELSQDVEMASALPLYPTPIICLAWAIVLHALPPKLVPPNRGYSGPAYQEMARRALLPSSGLLPWVETILAGPLLSASTTSLGRRVDRSETERRKVLKDLLVGLTNLVGVREISDRPGLYRAWDNLFSSGSPSTSLALSADYWVVDHPIPTRRALLDSSEFPHNPVLLPNLLAAFTGITAHSARTAEIYDVKPAEQVGNYFSNLETVVIPTDPAWYRFIEKDEQGRMLVEASRDIVLPGGGAMQAGEQGVVLQTEGSKQIVAWTTRIRGWTLLLEILRVATGLRGINDRERRSGDGSQSLSVADLGITAATGDVVASGTRLLSCMLRPIGQVAGMILEMISASKENPALRIIEVIYSVLQQYTTIEIPSEADTASATSSLDILVSLLHVDSQMLQSALRTTNFFGVPGRKPGLAYALVQLDSARGQHDITSAIVRLTEALVASSLREPTTNDSVVRAAVHHAFLDIWTLMAGWRYNVFATRYLLMSEVSDLFEMALANPLGPDGVTLTAAAQAAVDVLITSASSVTYRKVIENFTQAPALAHRLLSSQQDEEAAAVSRSMISAAKLLAALLRLAPRVGASAANLPFSLFASTVIVNGEKVSLVHALLHAASTASTPPECRVAFLKLARTYIETSSTDAQKPSLAGLLHDPEALLASLSRLVDADEPVDQQAAVWTLLASIASHQPGCAPACIGSGPHLAVPLEMAVKQIPDPEAIQDAPQVLAAALGYCQAALSSSSAYSVVPTVRANANFWKSVYHIAITPVATPPTFRLSSHAANFAARITAYACATQARANATALLATELQSLGSEDSEDRSEALELVLNSWRNGDKLSNWVEAAIHSSCDPPLHVREADKVRFSHLQLERLRAAKLESEREYGLGYLYDGSAQCRDSTHQPVVNLSLDTLNLNWSMLTADISLTRALHSLAEAVSPWSEGDGIAAGSALRAAVLVAAEVGHEVRYGDVMLSVQAERLEILAQLLDTALAEGTEPDHAQVELICGHIRKAIEKMSFHPNLSGMLPEVPPIHRPTLRIIHLLFASLASRPMTLQLEAFVEEAGAFVVQSADNALDAVSRVATATADLALAITPLSEMIGLKTTVWLDKLAESNIIVRSLELVKRARIQQDNVPAYMPSILLLHLALANHPASAEKLAVSGVMSAYSDNAIATEAEYGRIAPSPSDYSVHSAWCSMLLVIRTLLATLLNTSSFVRSEIIPFVRLTTAQSIRSLTWDGESPLTLPAIEEMHSAAWLFHAISRSMGANAIQLSDFASAALPLLLSIRFALDHPRLLSSYIVPATEEEQATLSAELAAVEAAQEVSLVDFGKTPVLASRAAEIVKVVRTLLLALIGFSGAWEVMAATRDADPGLIIGGDDGETTAAMDPIGVFNDFASLATRLSEATSTTTDDGIALLTICQQLAEAASVLSASQIYLRRVYLPAQSTGDTSEKRDEGSAGLGGSKRMSLGKGTERDRAEALLRDLESDWRGIQEADGSVGDRKLGRWLEEALDKAFEEGQE